MKNKPLNSIKIINMLIENQDVLKKYTVKKIGLFGSFIKNMQKKNSDVDLVVEFDVPSLDNFMDLIEYLENLFGRKVDILTPTGIETIRIKYIADDIKRSVVYV
jgi:predicted nucleotidyltransferase